MKVLVTGGSGFIGGYVLEQLEANGHDPVIFDHYDRKNYDYPVILGDVRDSASIVEAFAHVDGFIHLAAVLGTQETIKNPLPAAEVNILGGVNILNAASQYDIPGVYIGVGNHWMNNTYSITKTTIERFVHMFNREHGTRINIVRAMNAYGPRQRPAPPFGSSKVRKITPSFVCRAMAGMDVEIYGDGSQVSDMVHVRDVAQALVSALDKATLGYVFDTAIEVGPEVNNTVNEVAELIIRLCDSDSRIVHLPMRPGEVPNSVVKADTSTLSLVGMSADNLIDLTDGMRETVDYFKKSLTR